MKKTNAPKSISDLRENKLNPRKITQADKNLLAASLKEFGDLSGIVFNRRTGNLVGGHQRIDEFRRLQNGEPIEIVKEFKKPTPQGTVRLGYVEANGERFFYREVDWPVEREKLALVRANKSAGKFDDDILSDLLRTLDKDKNDLSLTGFDWSEIDELLKPKAEDDAPILQPVIDGDHVRMIQLFLNNKTLERFNDMVAELAQRYKTDNITDTVFKALETEMKKEIEVSRVRTATKAIDDSLVDLYAGTFLDDRCYDTLIEDYNYDVLKPNGDVLLKYRPNVFTPAEVRKVAPVFRNAAKTTFNRGMAAGRVAQSQMRMPVGKVTRSRYFQVKKDGTLSNTNLANPVDSGIIGYFDRSPRNPYCRLTAFNLEHGDQFASVLPYIQRIDSVFKRDMLKRYVAQKAIIRRTNPDFFIKDTAFTTVTVNKNFRTAVHKDAGDLARGFGVMSCLRSGNYTGCYLCFPKYRVAVNMQNGCVLMADVHEWHGNTPLEGIPGDYERISLVLYYREKMAECGSATDELQRIKMKRGKL